MTAVNYDKLCVEQVSEDDKTKIVGNVAHFKRNTNHSHSIDCEWVVLDKYENQEEKHDDENQDEYCQRQLRIKLNHFVQVFIPDSPELEYEAECINDDVDKEANNHTDTEGRRSKLPGKRKPVKTQTTYLSKLVDTWIEAKSKLTEEEFALLELVIKNRRTMKLKYYFKHIRYAIQNRHDGVIWGGATVLKRYDSGFKLMFFDKVNGLPVHIYCADATMRAYRHHRYFNEVLNEQKDYFNAYLLQADLVSTEKSYTFEIKDLKMFHLIAMSKKQ